MRASVIKPGLLVVLKSSVRGGVSYQRTELERDGEGKRARWETTRLVDDPEEHDRANKARSAAVKLIHAVCTHTSFGLLCPEAESEALEVAVSQARSIRDDFNDAAATCRVDVYVLKGRIASNDEEAARAIGREVQDLIEQMSAGIDALDPDAIRKAASDAARLSAMLAPERAEAVTTAVDTARRAARQIVKRIEKGGEIAAVVLADLQRGGIEKARMAFLDLEEPTKSAGQELPAVDLQRFAEVETSELHAADALEAPLPTSMPEIELDGAS